MHLRTSNIRAIIARRGSVALVEAAELALSLDVLTPDQNAILCECVTELARRMRKRCDVDIGCEKLRRMLADRGIELK